MSLCILQTDPPWQVSTKKAWNSEHTLLQSQTWNSPSCAACSIMGFRATNGTTTTRRQKHMATMLYIKDQSVHTEKSTYRTPLACPQNAPWTLSAIADFFYQHKTQTLFKQECLRTLRSYPPQCRRRPVVLPYSRPTPWKCTPTSWTSWSLLNDEKMKSDNVEKRRILTFSCSVAVFTRK